MPVNPKIKKPTSPGRWLTEEECKVCKAKYNDHRINLTFAEAAQELRLIWQGKGDPSGGYRSRNPVLFWMRVRKLTSWYETHFECGRRYRNGREYQTVIESRAMLFR